MTRKPIQIIIRIAKWYWEAICFLHRSWDNPLKFVIEALLSLNTLVFYTESWLAPFLDVDKWKAWLVNPLWLLIPFPVVVVFLMDKEIEELKGNLRSKIDKKALRDEILEMYKEGAELAKQLIPYTCNRNHDERYSLKSKSQEPIFMQQLKEWEEKDRKLFNQYYPYFWEKMLLPQEGVKEDLLDSNAKIKQDHYKLFIWRVEKLGKILEELSTEIRELGCR